MALILHDTGHKPGVHWRTNEGQHRLTVMYFTISDINQSKADYHLSSVKISSYNESSLVIEVGVRFHGNAHTQSHSQAWSSDVRAQRNCHVCHPSLVQELSADTCFSLIRLRL